MKGIFALILSFFGLCTSCAAQDDNAVSPEEFKNGYESDSSAVVLDVRRSDEFEHAHLPNAINLDWLNKDAFEHGISKLPKDRVYYVYCRSGRRSSEAATFMQEKGFRVVDMKGGINAWKKDGLPLER